MDSNKSILDLFVGSSGPEIRHLFREKYHPYPIKIAWEKIQILQLVWQCYIMLYTKMYVQSKHFWNLLQRKLFLEACL